MQIKKWVESWVSQSVQSHDAQEVEPHGRGWLLTFADEFAAKRAEQREEEFWSRLRTKLGVPSITTRHEEAVLRETVIMALMANGCSGAKAAELTRAIEDVWALADKYGIPY